MGIDNISEENEQEYANEKRAKELQARGKRLGLKYDQCSIAEMMKIPEHQVHKMLKRKTKEIVLDGDF